MVYVGNGDVPNNMIVSKDAVKIISVDIANTLVKGQMDASYDENNFVNGNFTLKYCK